MVGNPSLPERRELLYKTAQGLEGGRETLESWTRKELLELICLEMGKERKYTGVSKSKMVEHLLKLVSMKSFIEGMDPDVGSLSDQPTTAPSVLKRQRKVGRPSRASLAAQTNAAMQGGYPAWVCKNTACKAQLQEGASFCQRCSCCICKKFDDNKDPSLWIVCTPEPLNKERDCRLSCHIECALENDMAGVVNNGPDIVLDGCYQCPCGKVSDLIGCWKKQLLIVKDARRVDTFCQRLSLSYRLLDGTDKHKVLHELITRAVQKLEAEVGVITEGSAKFARGLVNRLSSSSQVLEIIHAALEKLETLDEQPICHSNGEVNAANTQERLTDKLCAIEFTDISSDSVSLTVRGGGQPVSGYQLWHRKASDLTFGNNPTCIIATNPGEAHISGLHPCTEYAFYVVPLNSLFEGGIGEPAEGRCITKADEVTIVKKPCATKGDEITGVKEACEAAAPLSISLNASINEKSICISDKFESNFKVRELGRVLHSVWAEDNQSAQMHKAYFHNKVDVKSTPDHRNDKNKKMVESKDSWLNWMSNQGASAAPVDLSPENAHSSDLNASVNLESNVEESRVTLEVDLPPLPAKTIRNRDSKAFLQERDVKDKATCADIMELDDISDPGISHVSHREETEALSQVASDIMQTNTINEAQDAVGNKCRMVDAESIGAHGQSWVLQVRSMAGTNIEMKPQATFVRKRTSENLGRGDNYGLINGCRGTIGAPLRATGHYEYCVKMIRLLECEGFLKEDFRMKFLTWFSLKASEHEKRVVSVFIDTLQDNPSSLAGQLVDTFSDIITAKRHHAMTNGFHYKLWH
ncbi:hypothetical protein KP509_19G072900 [Ceratopteris richardii]|nr:hypothetical protein KP509_19G072900 [Ceratopteris richardii]KAH7352971.1 hypothetical protein KP509_19G072900 [Ceratopteris richardii]